MALKARTLVPLGTGRICPHDAGRRRVGLGHAPASEGREPDRGYRWCRRTTRAQLRTARTGRRWRSRRVTRRSSRRTRLTIGSPDANGAAANSVGFIRIAVVGYPGPPDDSDVILTASTTDIRCKAGTAACGSANAADGADYTGELEGTPRSASRTTSTQLLRAAVLTRRR